MKQIILRFEMNHGLVGMALTTEGDNPTEDEEIVSSQMVQYIINGSLPSPTIVKTSGSTLEEAKIEADKILGRTKYSDRN